MVEAYCRPMPHRFVSVLLALALATPTPAEPGRDGGGLVTLSGGRVTLTLEAADHDVVSPGFFPGWLASLDQATHHYEELTGYLPPWPLGVTSTREPMRAWALSGHPIRWNQEWVARELTRMEREGDHSFGILHELGHVFDHRSWNYDAEHMANFKMAYVVEMGGLGVSQNDHVYRGREVIDFYEGKYREWIPAREGGCGDCLTYSLLGVAQARGWEPFKRTFREIRRRASGNPGSRVQRFDRFMDTLGSHLSEHPRDLFAPGDYAAYRASTER
jgi:hypothetical protein